MAKRSQRITEPAPEIAQITKSPAGTRVADGLWWLAVGTLTLSVIAMLNPEWRLWGVHQFAFLHKGIAIPLLLLATLLLSPLRLLFARLSIPNLAKLPPIAWAAFAFCVFMLFSVYGSLLGDGQLSLTRLAHVGDMLESNQHIPRGRFFSQKEPGTMLLHEGAFRIGMAVAGPDIYVARGPEGQAARVERQLIYRDIAQWCYRILSAFAGALLILVLINFTRSRKELSRDLFWFALLAGGGWLAFFGYVENYAWMSLAMFLFLMAGLKATEPPRSIPILPILFFIIAVAMHFMAIVLFPALVYLLWTMHFEPRDQATQNTTAPNKRLKLLLAGFAILGIAGYLYVKGWKGWISVIPLLPRWVDDGYALLSPAHGLDLLNLLLWSASAGVVILLLTRKLQSSIQDRNQENFLLLAAGSSAFFACVFSPNLGMARDWDIVAAALWPTIFYGAWRLAKLEHEDLSRLRMRATLLALILLLLVPAVLVQTKESTAIARFKNLLELDSSRSAYGWENLALYYQKTKELDKRIEAWRLAVSVERNPRYLFNLAEALRLDERYDEADTTAIAAASMNKDFAPNLFYYAVAQAKNSRYDRAKAIIDTALIIMPDIPYGQSMQTWANRVVFVDSIAQQGDTALALQFVTEFSSKDPENSFWPEYVQKLRP